MKNTELNLIPVFVAIYEERSLSKAAMRLDISQPAVSKALSRLRELYDEPLFHRSTSGVEPTAFSTDIYPALGAAYKNFTSTLDASRNFDPKVSKRVFSIACISSVSYWLIPELLKQIRIIAPNISFEVHPLFTEDYEMDLRLQRYDLIIDLEPTATTLKTELALNETLVVICSKDHPRIGTEITREEFLQEEHVVVSQWQSRGSLLGAQDIPELVQRNIKYRAPGILDMLPAVANTDLIGILPESVMSAFADVFELRSVPLPFTLKDYGLYIIWHPSRNSESGHIWLRNQLKLAVKRNA